MDQGLNAGAQRRTLVHTQLSSSAAYWGAGSLDEDAEELNLLARYLKQYHSSAVPARSSMSSSSSATSGRPLPQAVLCDSPRPTYKAVPQLSRATALPGAPGPSARARGKRLGMGLASDTPEPSAHAWTPDVV